MGRGKGGGLGEVVERRGQPRGLWRTLDLTQGRDELPMAGTGSVLLAEGTAGTEAQRGAFIHVSPAQRLWTGRCFRRFCVNPFIQSSQQPCATEPRIPLTPPLQR